MDWEIVEGVRKHFSVAHHTPGRIRLKFKAALADHPRAGEILEEGKKLRGVRNVRINVLARSIILEYDRKLIRPEWVQELFTTVSEDRIRELIDVMERA